MSWIARAINEEWTSVAISADGTRLIASAETSAVLGENGTAYVYISNNSGESWTDTEVDFYDRNWIAVAISSDGTKFCVAASDTLEGMIYISNNSGGSWYSSGLQRFWSGIAASNDLTKLVAITDRRDDYGDGYTISAGGQIYTSTNGGVNWIARESNRVWTSVASNSDGTKLVAVERGLPLAGGGRIYTSTDSGVSWTARESNRSWIGVASNSDGTKLVAAVDAGQIYTSTDSGESWVPRESNRAWKSVASNSDGTKLVAAVYGGRIYTSTDSGVSWTARESNRNWTSVAINSDGTKLVAAVYGGQIYTNDNSGIDASPTPTPTNTITPTNSITPTRSITPTNTVTPSATPTNTVTPSATPTNTVMPSATPTNTVTPSATPTNTVTRTATQTALDPSPSPTSTVTPSATPISSPRPSRTPMPTRIPGLTYIKCCEIIPSSTPTTTPTLTPTNTPTTTLTQTVTPTSSITPTNTPTSSITPTNTPTSSITPTNTPTSSVTPTITPTVTPTTSITPTITPTSSLTPTITQSITPTPTITPSISPTPSITPSVSPTRAATPTPTQTPSNSPTQTVTPTISITPTLTPSITTTLTPSPTTTTTPTLTPTVSCLAGSASSWVDISASVPDIISTTDLVGVAISKNGNNILICGTDTNATIPNPGDDARVYVSTNRGVSWSRITGYTSQTSFSGPFGPKQLSCAGISPNGQIMVIGSYPDSGSNGDAGIYISTDSGLTFLIYHFIPNRKILCIQPTNNISRIWVGTSRYYDTSTFPASFRNANIIRAQGTTPGRNLSYQIEAGASAFPLSRTASLSGFNDVYVSDSGSKVVFVTYGGKIWINNDGNNTSNWITRGPDNIWTGITGNSSGSILYALANRDYDSSIGNYVGDPGLFKSVDGGENWSKVTSFPGPPYGDGYPGKNKWGISMNEDGRRIIAGNSYGGYISHDYGNTWGQIIVFMNNTYPQIVGDSHDLSNDGSLAVSAWNTKVYISKCS